MPAYSTIGKAVIFYADKCVIRESYECFRQKSLAHTQSIIPGWDRAIGHIWLYITYLFMSGCFGTKLFKSGLILSILATLCCNRK